MQMLRASTAVYAAPKLACLGSVHSLTLTSGAGSRRDNENGNSGNFAACGANSNRTNGGVAPNNPFC